MSHPLGEVAQISVTEIAQSQLPPEPPSPSHPGLLGLKHPSSSFLGLVDQLVQKHQEELASACGKPASRNNRSTGRRSAGSVDSTLSQTWSDRGHVEETTSPHFPRMTTPNTPTAANFLLRRDREKKTRLSNVNASTLADAFDEKTLKTLTDKSDSFGVGLSPALHNDKNGCSSSFAEWIHDRDEQKSCWERCQDFLQSTRYELIIAFVLAVNVFCMALEMELRGVHVAGVDLGLYPSVVQFDSQLFRTFSKADKFFAFFFVFDVLLRVCVLQCRFFHVCLNYVDILVSLTSLAEVVLTWETEGDELSGTSGSMPVNPLIFKLLRLGKLARAIRMITMSSMLLSLQLLIKCLTASRGMLLWSFCLLSLVQCVAGMTLSTLCQDYIEDPLGPFEIREEVFRYYGTWTRTMLSMFEILFANWGPPCRILVDHVHEAFSIFFLVYRCVLGFAVLNVVNAVFVQQTLRTANSDEDLAFREKQRDIASYTRKIRKLFQTMDTSGDGTINYEEFSKLVSDPKLNFWIGQLELEYHDLMSLFEFLDNGDGEITFSEFIEGATRLRGQAKALDIWRMETKVEVLFEEVLNILAGPGQGPLSDRSWKNSACDKRPAIEARCTRRQRHPRFQTSKPFQGLCP
ncbi:unnamed protein product [Durusdinium trenchii]|uniref:EF-hand domain-containing protein n=1 Tax=Durusdinium trenchii TaxID=1381693 RepID=A0ABP0MQX1_9DINO